MKNTFTWPSSRFWVRLFSVVLVLAAVYAVLAGVIAPNILQSKLPKMLSEMTGKPVRLGELAFNPFDLRLRLSGLVIESDEPERPHLSLDYLLLDLEPSSLFTGVAEVREFALVRPRIMIEHRANGEVRVGGFLMPSSAPKTGKASPPPAKTPQNGDEKAARKAPPTSLAELLPLPVRLCNVSILAGVLAVSDRPRVAYTEVADITLRLPLLSSEKKGTLVMDLPGMSADFGPAHVNVSGSASPFAADPFVRLTLTADHFTMLPIQAFLPGRPPLRLSVDHAEMDVSIDTSGTAQGAQGKPSAFLNMAVHGVRGSHGQVRDLADNVDLGTFEASFYALLDREAPGGARVDGTFYAALEKLHAHALAAEQTPVELDLAKVRLDGSFAGSGLDYESSFTTAVDDLRVTRTLSPKRTLSAKLAKIGVEGAVKGREVDQGLPVARVGASLQGLSLSEKDGEKAELVHASLARLQVDGLDYDGVNRRIASTAVTLREPFVHVTRAGDGHLPIVELLTQAARISQDQTPPPPKESGPVPDINLGQLAILDGRVEVFDQSLNHLFVVNPFSLFVNQLSTQPAAKPQLYLDAASNSGEVVQLGGIFNRGDGEGAFVVSVGGIDASKRAELLARLAPGLSLAGRLGVDVTVGLSVDETGKKPPAIRLGRGYVAASNLRVVQAAQGVHLEIGQGRLDNLNVDLAAKSVNIDAVSLHRGFAGLGAQNATASPPAQAAAPQSAPDGQAGASPPATGKGTSGKASAKRGAKAAPARKSAAKAEAAPTSAPAAKTETAPQTEAVPQPVAPDASPAQAQPAAAQAAQAPAVQGSTAQAPAAQAPTADAAPSAAQGAQTQASQDQTPPAQSPALKDSQADATAASVQSPSANPLAATGYKIQLGALRLKDFDVILGPSVTGAPSDYRVSRVDAEIKGISSQTDAPLTLRVAAGLPSGGIFSLSGQAWPFVPKADLALDISGLDLQIAAKTVPPGLILSQAKAYVKGQVKGDLSQAQNPRGSFNGSIGLEGLSVRERSTGQELLGLGRLDLTGVETDLERQSAKVARLLLTKGRADVVLLDGPTLNVLRAAQAAPTAAQASSLATVAPANEAPPAAKQEAKPAPQAANHGAKVGPEPQIFVKEVRLEDFNLKLTDQTVKPYFRTQIEGLNLIMHNVGLDRTIVFDMKARLKQAPLTAVGTVTPGRGNKLGLAMVLSAEGVDMTQFTPYARKFVGQSISRGLLNLKLDYNIKDLGLAAQNTIKLKNITLIKSSDAGLLHLPIGLALAILEDDKGEINLDIPIKGTLDKMQLGLSDVIGDAFGGFFAKVLLSPFAVLRLPFGDGQAASIPFAPSSYTLDPSQMEPLAKLAEVLSKRGLLALELQGVVDPKADDDGIRRTALRVQQAELVRRFGGNPQDEAQLADALPSAYSALVGRSVDPKRGPPAAEMEKALLASMPATAQEQSALAEARANAVREALVKLGVDPERVFILQGDPTAQTAGHPASPRVDLRLR